MMQQWSRLVAGIVALVAGLVAAPVAGAAPLPDVDAHTRATLVITKLEQPEGASDSATGLPIHVPDAVAIADVRFSATAVPGIDLTTPDGREAARNLTVREALSAIAAVPAAASGTTAADGVVTFADLPIGYYLVQETSTPAGVVGAEPFLVALPLQLDDGTFLDTVYVYPKNGRVEAELAVRDDQAITIGDTVRWTSVTTIPRVSELTSYRVQNVVAPGLALIGTTSDVTVSLTGPVALTATDYQIALTSVDGRAAIDISFTPAGLAKLAAARIADPGAAVTVDYATTVLSGGVHTNEVRLTAAAAGGPQAAAVTARASTKFGPLTILVHEQNHPETVIPGAVFQLYLSASDAAARRNPLTIAGVSAWTTDADGRIVIENLRFSDFVNGLDRSQQDELFRFYWAQPVSYPAGWTGELAAVSGIVNAVDRAEVLEFLVVRSASPTPGPSGSPDPSPGTGGELPWTGAQVTGIAMLGTALVAGGIVVLVRRRSGEREDPAGASHHGG